MNERSADLPAFQLLTDSDPQAGLYLVPVNQALETAPINAGKVRPTSPVRLARQQGARIGDQVRAAGNLRLLSPAFQRLLTEGGFSGWHTYAVELVDAELAAALEGYRGLAITGRAGRIDEERSPLVAATLSSKWERPRQARKGIFFVDDHWDGSDLFRAGDAGYVFATPALVAAVKKARLKNVKFEPAADHEARIY